MSNVKHYHIAYLKGTKSSIQVAPEQVLDALYANNRPMTMLELGESLGVHANCISNVVRGRTGTFNVRGEKSKTIVDISESLKAHRPGWNK